MKLHVACISRGSCHGVTYKYASDQTDCMLRGDHNCTKRNTVNTDVSLKHEMPPLPLALDSDHSATPLFPIVRRGPRGLDPHAHSTAALC